MLYSSRKKKKTTDADAPPGRVGEDPGNELGHLDLWKQSIVNFISHYAREELSKVVSENSVHRNHPIALKRFLLGSYSTQRSTFLQSITTSSDVLALSDEFLTQNRDLPFHNYQNWVHYS